MWVLKDKAVNKAEEKCTLDTLARQKLRIA